MFGLPSWKRAEPEPPAEPVDEMAAMGGFRVLTFEQLPADMQRRIQARRAERGNPEHQDSGYDVLRWE